MPRAAWPRSLNLRYLLTILVLVLIALLLLYRSFILATDSPLPASQRENPDPIRRGIIFDSLDHELAISRETYSVAVRPADLPDINAYIQTVTPIIGIPAPELRRKISDPGRKFVYLARKLPLTPEKVTRLRGLAATQISSEPNRYYPNDTLAASVLGFTDIDNQGLAGIEFQFNDTLTLTEKNGFVGHNVHLTLNSFIQQRLEAALRDTVSSSGAIAATGIVSETSTGRILAMASLPGFDPNNPAAYTGDQQRNRAISDTYEPGSTFKIFTLAALARESQLDHKTTWECPGYFEYRGFKVRCAHAHGRVGLREIVRESCNSGMIALSWNLPVVKLHEAIRSFGIGSSTDISLPGETRGYLPPLKKWDLSLKMSIPIGHGLRVTPLQLVTAANIIANDGEMIPPQIVDKISNPDGKTVQKFSNPVRVRPIKPEIAREVRNLLTDVTGAGGTGYLANPGIRDATVCGKTGTSIKSTSTGYEKGKYQSSFIGFFPCDRPQVTILVMIDEPKGAAYQGGAVAAPVFRKVLSDILPLIHTGDVRDTGKLPGLAFDRNINQSGVMPSLTGLSKKEALRILWKATGRSAEVTGAGYVRAQSPSAGSNIDPETRISLQFGF